MWLLVRCLACDHCAVLADEDLRQHRASIRTPMAKLSRVLKCSECQSGAVKLEMADDARACEFLTERVTTLPKRQ